jgi:glycosyltransferase involved in cell wall biosynthesis
MIKDQKKPVVMQILPALESGGVERGTIDIAKALKKADFYPIVVSGGGALVYELQEAGIQHVKLAVNSKNPLVIFLNNKKIAALIKKYRVSIVHVRSRAPMWSSYFSCKKTRVKLVATVHGVYSTGFWKYRVFFLKKIYNSIMLKADVIIAVSNFIKNYLIENYQNFSPEKITVIARGADLNYFNSTKVSKNRLIDLSKMWHLAEDKKIILMPARFSGRKGHEFLVEALALVKNDFLCLMVGSDHCHSEFRKKIEKKIIKKNLADKVKIVGVCKDMAAAYAISHLVVCPSIGPEAFGRIAIEAQAAKKIIIATKIGGSLETIIDNKTGFLVEAGDIENFARLIDMVLKMPETEAGKIENAARKNIEENFSNQKMCDETLKLYRTIQGTL